MSLTDWFATLAHVTGMKVPQKGPFASDSIDNWRYIVGKTQHSARTEIMMHYAPGKKVSSSLRRGDYKIIVDENSTSRLIHLTNDLEEKSQNVTSERPELAAEMLEAVWQSRCAALSMPWFSVDPPEPHQEWGKMTCHAWKMNGGFLGPWAELRNEHNMRSTLFTPRKALISESKACLADLKSLR